VQSGWLCYGWPSGAYRCTQHWYRASSGAYVSRNPGWVPSEGSARTGASSVHATTYTVAYSAKSANTYPWGFCTWGAMALAHDNLNGLGNAKDWLWNAQRRGLPTGYTPRVGATVVFAPGVQGASWLGHVGHIVQVGPHGSFLMEAMNDSGGFGRYSYRWVHAGYGVAFIY
jgi:surface antigen